MFIYIVMHSALASGDRQTRRALSDNPAGVSSGLPRLAQGNKSDGTPSSTSQSRFMNNDSGEEGSSGHKKLETVG